MMGVGSYCWVAVSSAFAASSKIRSRWFCFRFFGLGIGVMNETRRRLSMIRFVGWPASSSSQWRDGYS